ncbi:HetP family heterocyst commitment protein [Nostoc sp. TCL26-01]|uniref:HetP family heterocyst commitment protein n=1 Tax=Nostoc sp. TCL26-01 TaxID=2576904 RepID=UPI0015B83B81|nr:HetP family heterocyst commitment protein [Nostoc sp. TCL26-01]QLE58397.1 heterocyst formation protein HetP [Nostoc sp. TCL26-01]
MYQQETNYNSQTVKNINTDQVEQIVKAIIAGKYSWACVLLLRFSGYNPIDYIPYRTYIRLLKNNYLNNTDKTAKSDNQEVFDLPSNWIPNKNVGLKSI